MKEHALYHWPGVTAYLSEKPELRARSSPWHLQTFVVGCQLAFSDLALDIRGDVQLLDGFCKFVVAKYGKHPNIWCTFTSLASAPIDGASRFLEDWTEYITPLKSHAAPVPWVTRDHRSRGVDIRPHLKEFRKKPNFIFPSADITHLRAFVEAYEFVVMHQAQVELVPDFVRFETWLREHRKMEGRCPWDMLLTNSCGGDTQRALTKAFDTLDDFCAGRT